MRKRAIVTGLLATGLVFAVASDKGRPEALPPREVQVPIVNPKKSDLLLLGRLVFKADSKSDLAVQAPPTLALTFGTIDCEIANNNAPVHAKSGNVTPADAAASYSALVGQVANTVCLQFGAIGSSKVQVLAGTKTYNSEVVHIENATILLDQTAANTQAHQADYDLNMNLIQRSSLHIDGSHVSFIFAGTNAG